MLPLLEKLVGVLDGEPDPVNQQIAVELLAARHVMRVSRAACRAEIRPRQYAQAHPANPGRPGSWIELLVLPDISDIRTFLQKNVLSCPNVQKLG